MLKQMKYEHISRKQGHRAAEADAVSVVEMLLKRSRENSYALSQGRALPKFWSGYVLSKNDVVIEPPAA